MAFIIKKKRYKFQVRELPKPLGNIFQNHDYFQQVDLTLNELTEVSFGKAILFAKVFHHSECQQEMNGPLIRVFLKNTFSK